MGNFQQLSFIAIYFQIRYCFILSWYALLFSICILPGTLLAKISKNCFFAWM